MRSQWQKMVTTEVIIAQMNALSVEIKLREDDVQEEIREMELAREIQQQEQEKAVIIRTEDGEPNKGPEQGASLGMAEDIVVEEAKDQECPELVP